MGAGRGLICYSRTQGPASCYVSRREQSDIAEAQSFHASDLLREGGEIKAAEIISPQSYGLPPLQESGELMVSPSPQRKRWQRVEGGTRTTGEGRGEWGNRGKCAEGPNGQRCLRSTRDRRKEEPQL